ncbi:MAG: Ppx/GppA phosphatase family protein [Acidimicrobiales bacterium]
MSVVAAIDIGSVSTRMLVVDGERRIRRTVDTLLGGMSLRPDGRIRPEPFAAEALDRLRAALGGFRRLVDEAGATEVRVVGTAAARATADLAPLAEVVASCLGAELEVLAGDREAALAFVGVASGLPLAAGPVVTIDIGGGSTEFVLGYGRRATATCSLPLGGALLTRAYLGSDPPRADELSAALSIVELHIDDVHRAVPELGPALPSATVVGLGAVVTVAAIEVGEVGVDAHNGDGDGPYHGFELTREAVEDVFRTIATESRADRAFNPGLPPTRVDDIVGACAVLVETMRRLALDRVVVSQRGLLEGIASEMSAGRG